MLTLIDPEQALDLVLANVAPLPSSLVPLEEAAGLALAQTIRADRDYPPFPRAMMDGFAVRLADAGTAVELAGEVAAGDSPSVPVTAGRCVSVMTGAPCPEGTEAVVMVEQTDRDGDRVTLPAAIRAGQHLAPEGSECRAGAVVLEAGARLSPLAVAILASVGRRQVQATDLPRSAVVTTGRELAQPGEKPGMHQIRNSNGPMLAAQLRLMGLPDPLMLHADDTEASLAGALASAAEADVVLLTGGVSMGRFDLVPAALQAFGARGIFHNVLQEPGKPLLFAVRDGGRLVFGLPGNPLSSHFCFHRYVGPALRRMAGRTEELPFARGHLTAPLAASSARHLFLLANAGLGPEADGVEVHAGRGSADIWSAPGANAYVWLLPGDHDLPAGAEVAVQRLEEPR